MTPDRGEPHETYMKYMKSVGSKKKNTLTGI